MIPRCDWYGEGRGRCLLDLGHKPNFHTCEEDGRLIELHRCVMLGDLKNCDPKLTVDVALAQMNRIGTYERPTENEQTILVLGTELIRMRRLWRGELCARCGKGPHSWPCDPHDEAEWKAKHSTKWRDDDQASG